MRRPAALLLALLTALTACTGTASPPPGSVTGVRQGSSTVTAAPAPDLARLRAASALEACPVLPTAAAVRDGLPALRLRCLGRGGAVPVGSLRGPALVNFWSTTCEECLLEMPLLQQAHQRWGGRVRVLGVDSQDLDPAGALELVRQVEVTYPSVVDPGGDVLRGRPQPLIGLPYTLFVAADGHVAWVQPGRITSLAGLRSLVREHLHVAVPA